MEVESDTIQHLAELANFSVSETQAKSLKKDLGEILKYISQLDEIKVDDIEPTYQVFEMENVWRDDEILPQDAEREALLDLAEEVEDHQIKVPKVL